MQTRKEIIEITVKDLVKDLMYYDRKEDEDLPWGSIEDALEAGEVSIEEMVGWFEARLRQSVANSK